MLRERLNIHTCKGRRLSLVARSLMLFLRNQPSARPSVPLSAAGRRWLKIRLLSVVREACLLGMP